MIFTNFPIFENLFVLKMLNSIEQIDLTGWTNSTVNKMSNQFLRSAYPKIERDKKRKESEEERQRRKKRVLRPNWFLLQSSWREVIPLIFLFPLYFPWIYSFVNLLFSFGNYLKFNLLFCFLIENLSLDCCLVDRLVWLLNFWRIRFTIHLWR